MFGRLRLHKYHVMELSMMELSKSYRMYVLVLKMVTLSSSYGCSILDTPDTYILKTAITLVWKVWFQNNYIFLEP